MESNYVTFEASTCWGVAHPRSVRTIRAGFSVLGNGHGRNMASAEAQPEREGHAVGAKQPIGPDVRGQAKAAITTPHAPGCCMRVV